MPKKKCTKCNIIKPYTDFFKHTYHKDGLSSNCKDCQHIIAKISYLKHREKILKRNAKNALERVNKGVCRNCTKPLAGKSLCRDCLDKQLHRRRLIRKMLYDHYGYTCQCCKLTFESEFLNLDHINNDGAKMRREHGRGGAIKEIGVSNIRKGNFPKHLQTKCWNCNCAKGMFGYCPHEKNGRN